MLTRITVASTLTLSYLIPCLQTDYQSANRFCHKFQRWDDIFLIICLPDIWKVPLNATHPAFAKKLTFVFVTGISYWKFYVVTTFRAFTRYYYRKRNGPRNWFHINKRSMCSTHEAMFCLDLLIYWGRDKIDAISQTTLPKAFSGMKLLEFRFKFHWSLFSGCN